MKKIVWILLFALLLGICAPFSVLTMAEETLPPLWDGTAAKGLAGGDGSLGNPFRIESPEQFAYFNKSVQDGETYSGKYVKLCTDIRINDETFTFDADTGLVQVTDGQNTAYCGTGRTGDDSGSDTRFDTDASLLGSWYDEKGAKIANYPGTLYPMEAMYFFAGNFEGVGHTISGMYMQGNGLFANMEIGKLSGIHVENSLIIGNQYVGSILGQASQHTVTVQYCTSSSIVLGGSCVGGVAGRVNENSLMSGCENSGIVIGQIDVGGVVGNSRLMDYCLNRGDVYGIKSVGGIAGVSSFAEYCTNMGKVTGNTNIGGICGVVNDSVTFCHNLGPVYGSYHVGGICGSGSDDERSDATFCYNKASVKGTNYVGGIAGVCAVGKSLNDGVVTGESYVGGIAGMRTVNGSQNNGNVLGNTYVGGITGNGDVRDSGNYGMINGKSYVGGVAGSQTHYIYNCFNQGTVDGIDAVGGIVGLLHRQMEGGYNAGKVKGMWNVGSVVGNTSPDTTTVRNLYYLKGTAVNIDGKLQNGVGGRVDASFQNVRSLTEKELRQADTYTQLDLVMNWKSTDHFPVPRLMNGNFDSHDQAKVEKECYLFVPVDCDATSFYRISCTCGAVLDGLFEGKTKNHYPSDGKWLIDNAIHFQICGRCNEHILELSHIFDPGKVVQNGKDSEVIRGCAICGYEQHIPIDLNIESPEKTPDQAPKKAEFTVDLRFVLLLIAGVILGAIGSYGFFTVRTLRNQRKQANKKKNFI